LAKVRVAQAEVDQARLLPNPILSIAFRFPEGGGGKPIIEGSIAADLLAILQRPQRISAADARLRSAVADALTTALDVLADVQERYAAVQALDAQVVVLEQRAKLVQRLLELAKARVAAGEAGQLDAITLESERASLDVEIALAASERRVQRMALARLVGRPGATADWPLTPWSPPAEHVASETAWIASALEHRPEIQSRQWEIAALGSEVSISKLAVLEGSEIGVAAERDPKWSVGPAVAVPIPLLDWGQAKRAKVQAQRVEAIHQLTQSRRQVVEEVRRAFESLRASQSALKTVQERLIPLAERRREQAEAAYKNGFADVTAVLLAEQDAQAARGKQIELQQKASAAYFQLQRAAGSPGPAPTTQAMTETR
jgi:outer membrane protein TolC